MNEILMDGRNESFVVAAFKTNAIVDTCVVHDSIDTTELMTDDFHSRLTFGGNRQLCRNLKTSSATIFDLTHNFEVISFIPTNDDGYCSFGSETSHDTLSYALGSAGNNDDFILKKKIHSSSNVNKNKKIGLRGPQRE